MMTMKYQDLHLSDVDLNTQFKQYMSAGQYEAALAILQNDQLTDKTVVAALFNVSPDGKLKIRCAWVSSNTCPLIVSGYRVS